MRLSEILNENEGFDIDLAIRELNAALTTAGEDQDRKSYIISYLQGKRGVIHSVGEFESHRGAAENRYQAQQQTKVNKELDGKIKNKEQPNKQKPDLTRPTTRISQNSLDQALSDTPRSFERPPNRGSGLRGAIGKAHNLGRIIGKSLGGK